MNDFGLGFRRDKDPKVSKVHNKRIKRHNPIFWIKCTSLLQSIEQQKRLPAAIEMLRNQNTTNKGV